MSKQTILDMCEKNITPTDHMPVGFWWHYTRPFTVPDGTNNPELLAKTIKGHVDMYNTVHPDVIKIMIEGYFTYPTLDGIDLHDPKQLMSVGHADLNHPFFQEQIKMSRAINDAIGDGAATFYSIFVPYYWMLFAQVKYKGVPMEKDELAEIVKKYPKEIKHVQDTMMDDIIEFAKMIIGPEGGSTGVFFPIFNFNKLTKEQYLPVFHDAEKRFCDELTAVRNTVMVHVCGHNAGRESDLSYYDDLNYKILNLDTDWEHKSIKTLKEMFPDKIIIGGYNQNPGTLLYTGTKEEIQQKAKDMVAEAGRDRFIIGAGCAMSTELASMEHCRWVREIADTL